MLITGVVASGVYIAPVPTPVPTPVPVPVPVAPTPVPVAPTPVPVAPTPVPVAPTPVAPTPVACVMPNVIGLSESAASNAIIAAGLLYEFTYYTSVGATAGNNNTVQAQDPAPGSTPGCSTNTALTLYSYTAPTPVAPTPVAPTPVPVAPTPVPVAPTPVACTLYQLKTLGACEYNIIFGVCARYNEYYNSDCTTFFELVGCTGCTVPTPVPVAPTPVCSNYRQYTYYDGCCNFAWYDCNNNYLYSQRDCGATCPGTPVPVAPTPVAPTPVAPTPVAPTPVAPTPVAPTPVVPTPVACTVNAVCGETYYNYGESGCTCFEGCYRLKRYNSSCDCVNSGGIIC